jgi:hypothetical protein
MNCDWFYKSTEVVKAIQDSAPTNQIMEEFVDPALIYDNMLRTLFKNYIQYMCMKTGQENDAAEIIQKSVNLFLYRKMMRKYPHILKKTEL